MKVRNYYLALFLGWLYLDSGLPLEKWFDVRFFPGHDGVFMEIKSKRKIKKEECIIKKCREFMDQWMSDHIVIDGGNKIIWLYKDDTMTDDYISKAQDIVFDKLGKDWNVKVVYNWKNTN